MLTMVHGDFGSRVIVIREMQGGNLRILGQMVERAFWAYKAEVLRWRTARTRISAGFGMVLLS
jgi:hypothetical protein